MAARYTCSSSPRSRVPDRRSRRVARPRHGESRRTRLPGRRADLRVRLSGLRFDSELSAHDLSTGIVEIPELNGNVQFDAGTLSGRLHVRETAGHLQIDVNGDTADNSLDSLRLQKVSLDSEHFQVEPLLTLLKTPVTDVAGALDGQMTISFDGNPQAQGQLSLSGGRVHVPTLGQDFEDVELEIVDLHAEVVVRLDGQMVKTSPRHPTSGST